MKQELWQYSVKELIDGYKKKLFNSLEVSLSVINQIKSLNKKINAFVHFDEEMVIDQAKLSKDRWERDMIKGILDGIPISVKDLIITQDYPTFRGSFNTSLPNKSEENAPVVSKIINSGAIILGKTATPEFGHKGTTSSKRYGETLNPWNLNTNAGGSSGGSAAAVASGMGPLSIGTDGGGSIRIPCSFCGLFGHKPTFGRIPAYPISPFGTVANIGPISRNVLDGSILMDVIATPDNKDWHSLPFNKKSYNPFPYENISSIRVGFTRLWGMEKYIENLKLEDDVEIGIESIFRSLKEKKFNITDEININWPNNPEKTFKVIWYTGAANLARKIKQKDLKDIDENFLEFIERGKKNNIFDIMQAETNRAENGSYITKMFEKYDFIIGPTLPVTAIAKGRNIPKGWDEEDLFSWTPFTYPFNLTKNPSSTINCNFSSIGLPVGLQIVAPIYKDHDCIKFAQLLEETFDLNRSWPKLSYEFT